MSKAIKSRFSSLNFSKTQLLVFTVVFVGVGSYFMWQAFAATTCLVSNRTTWAVGGADCTYNHTITVTNQGWACNRPLSSYGPLPIKVVSNSTVSWDGNAVTLDNGCTGDNNPDTIDLIIEVNANGLSGGVGAGSDSSKFRQDPGPQNIQITGKFECGRPSSGAHPDTWQFQSSSTNNMVIVNGTTGNWNAGTATCQGAGGAIFWSDQTKVDILGGEYVSCNHGILATQAGGSGSRVIDAKFRTGRNEPVSGGGDPNCQGYNASPPCVSTNNLAVFQNVTCQRWNASSNTWVNDGSPPPPPSNQPTVSLSANPTSISSGGSSTLNWNSTNATTCTASGAWSGSRATSGTQSVSPTQTSVYNLSCTGSGGIASASVTVSVTATPPPPSGGTTIRVTSGSWTCDRPLSQYGSLPITLIHTARVLEDAVSISSNCTGDTNPNTIDLILNINGNGGNIGTGQDAVKVGSSPGTVRPHDIQITGYAECGAVTAGAHQDVIQILSGERIQFIDFRSGNVNSRTFTCRGAGGAFFPTSTSPGDPERQPRDVVCIRCQFVTSNHGLFIGWSLRSGARDSTFVAQRPSTIDGAVEPVNINNTLISTGSGDPPPPPPPPADTPPTVSITSPDDGSSVSGTVNVTADASDDNSVSKVEFYIDGTLRGTDTTSGYSYSWNTTSLLNGTHSIIARAYDNANNQSTHQISVNVANADTTPPSTPTNLSVTASAYNRVNLSWTASTDNIGVTGYYIVRNGTTIANRTGTGTTYTDTTVNGSTSYTYQVIAYDARGNNSQASSQAEVRTPAPPSPNDTIPPSTPTNLTAVAASTSQINLSWTRSTDNVGVTSYDIYRGTPGASAARIATITPSAGTTTITYGNTGLSASTTYNYYVIAKDSAGNSSVPSITATATTQSSQPPQTSNGSLTGRVRSSDRRGEIRHANVNVTVNGNTQYYRTDSTGNYIIQRLPAGTHPTKYRANGHKHLYTTNTIASGQTTIRNVTLQAR